MVEANTQTNQIAAMMGQKKESAGMGRGKRGDTGGIPKKQPGQKDARYKNE
jgi:hypothetical protein